MIKIVSTHSPTLLFLNIKNMIGQAKYFAWGSLSQYLLAVFWRFFSLSIAIQLCRLPLPISDSAKRDRHMAKVWQRNFHFILGKPAKIGRSELIRRRFMLNSAFHHLQPNLIDMLYKCAAELEPVRSKVIEQGHVPIFAPLHILSDVLAGIVVTITAPKRTHIYSIYQDGFLGKNESGIMSKLGFDVFHHHPAESPAQQRVIFRELKSAKTNVIIFPDALPQCTMDSLDHAMPSHRTILFGRPASLHSGAEKMAKMVGGKLIPFYIFWDDELARLSIRIFEPCDGGDMLANCMEQALKECGDQWPLWHYPSLFYFNDAGK